MNREKNIEQLEHESYDLLVIGGGITGAGIAQDAALRGLRTALIEKRDFSFGTSSKSSKLIHGGLRYLKQMQFGVTRAMIKERNLLHRLAPSLIRWLPFMIPNYPWTPSRRAAVGLWVYDAIAHLKEGRSHHTISGAEALALAPALQTEGLHNAAVFWDCVTDDCRLVITVLKSASTHGACIANYIEAIDILKSKEHITGVIAKDNLGGKQLEIRARCVVNATGAWMDGLRKRDAAGYDPLLFLSKGIHIVVPQAKLPLKVAILFYSPDDHRVLFAIPMDPLVILGTTETPYHNDLDSPRAEAEEVEYILRATHRTFRIELSSGDIISTFAGVRPLLNEDREFSSDISRKHRIYISDSGLISVGGGKLTTYRHIAKDVMDIVTKKLKKRARCVTARAHLLSADPSTIPTISPHEDVQMHLEGAYGTECRTILDICRSTPSLADRIVFDLPYLKAEAMHCVRHEMAVTLSDFLCRRTRIVWQDPDHGLRCADEIARLMGSELSWTEEDMARQIEAYRHEAQLYSVPQRL